MDSAAWIDAFVMHVSKPSSRASPEELTDMAAAYYITHERSDPGEVAQRRVDEMACFTPSEQCSSRHRPFRVAIRVLRHPIYRQAASDAQLSDLAQFLYDASVEVTR